MKRIYKLCKCGKQFEVYAYRAKTAKYCSRQCLGKYAKKFTGKSDNGRLAKLGNKNPMYGKHLSDIHKQRQSESLKKFYDKKGRVSKEHKRKVKLLLNHKRRSMEKGKFSVKEWEILKKQYNDTCPCCKKSEPEIKLTIDHIIPISKGGLNEINNIQPLCSQCNFVKNNKHSIKYENLS